METKYQVAVFIAFLRPTRLAPSILKTFCVVQFYDVIMMCGACLTVGRSGDASTMFASRICVWVNFLGHNH